MRGDDVLKEGYVGESKRWKNVGMMVCFIFTDLFLM